jgi:hypothetical protein
LAKSSNRLNAERIRQLAVSGAEKLLKELRAEIAAVERTFPELATPAGRRSIETRTRQMSTAARKEVSARMKKYWAERRKAKAK